MNHKRKSPQYEHPFHAHESNTSLTFVFCGFGIDSTLQKSDGTYYKPPEICAGSIGALEKPTTALLIEVQNAFAREPVSNQMSLQPYRHRKSYRANL